MRDDETLKNTCFKDLHMIKRFFWCLMVCCFISPLYAAVTKVAIKKETKNYIVEIYYPQGYKEKKINTTVKQMIDNRLNNFLKYASLKDSLPPEVTGKNSLYIKYKEPYNNNEVVSLLFDISIYDRGAAHPRNSEASFNFIKGKIVNLNDLFLPDSNYLVTLSDISREKLAKMDFPDKEWMMKGTAPTQENFRTWYFTPTGITIVFGNYQVAAYVYGSSTVEIPKESVEKMMDPEIAQAIWGTNE